MIADAAVIVGSGLLLASLALTLENAIHIAQICLIAGSVIWLMGFYLGRTE